MAFSLQTFIYIADSSGAVWQVGVNDSGVIQAPVASVRQAQTIILVPILSYPFAFRNAAQETYLALVPQIPKDFQLIVSGGVLTTTPVPTLPVTPPLAPDAEGPQRPADVLLRSPNGTFYRLKCNAAGALSVYLSWQNNPLASSFGQNPGQLFLTDTQRQGPLPVQPGGPGTQVSDPKSLPGELTGIFSSGCGHSLTSWESVQVSVNGQPMVLIRCPYCGWVSSQQLPAALDELLERGGIITG